MTISVLVGPLPPAGDGDGDGAGGAGVAPGSPADVLVVWRPTALAAPTTSAREPDAFVVLERSVADFLRLERELQAADAPRSLSLPPLVAALNDKSELTQALQTPARRRQRLRFALEAFLTQLLATSDSLTGAQARRLRQFVQSDVVGRGSRQADAYGAVVGRALSLAEPPSPLRGEFLPAGCSFESETAVATPAALVVWRYTSQRSQLKFSADFVAGDAQEPADDAVGQDPYSLAAFSAEAASAELCNSDQTARTVVRYLSAVDFPDDLTDGSFVYGHHVVQQPGTLRLVWENADLSCVLSKQLQFQVAVILEPDAAAVIAQEIEALEAESLMREGGGAWVREFVRSSRSLVAPEDLPEWCAADDDSDGQIECEDDVRSEPPDQGQLAVELAQAHRVQALEARVALLEQELDDAKDELKRANDRVEISDEIYKASLETITRLEHEAAAGRVEARKAQEDGESEPNVQKHPLAEGSIRDEKELERLQQLCASFQEQCLWRSIDTAESEKRNLVLDGKLAEAKQEKVELLDRIKHMQERMEVVERDCLKFKTERAVLIKEVKRLQPYSKINLAALVQEAQEARMMQRSLQAQLDALRLDRLPPPAVEPDVVPTDFVMVESGPAQATEMD